MEIKTISGVTQEFHNHTVQASEAPNEGEMGNKNKKKKKKIKKKKK